MKIIESCKIQFLRHHESCKSYKSTEKYHILAKLVHFFWPKVHMNVPKYKLPSANPPNNTLISHISMFLKDHSEHNIGKGGVLFQCYNMRKRNHFLLFEITIESKQSLRPQNRKTNHKINPIHKLTWITYFKC